VISDGAVPVCVFHRKMASDAVEADSRILPFADIDIARKLPARPSATGSSPTKKPIGTLWSGQVAPHGAYRLALGVDSCKLAYVDL
jgi:hypothetical protein